MKKVFSIITLCGACVTLTACNSAMKSSNTISEPQSIQLESESTAVENTDAFSKLELVQLEGARAVPDSLETLEKTSDIAVVGEFIADTEQEYDREKDPIPRSYNTIKVTKVLMGSVNVGDELKIEQFYGINNGKLITVSELTPMQKGDEWVFFLDKDSNRKIYYCSADSDSRFPTKRSASRNRSMSLAADAKLGVYAKENFNQGIYDEVVKKYDV